MPSKRPRYDDDDEYDDRPRRRRRYDDDEDDRPRPKRKKEGMGIAATLGIVFGVLLGVGAILVVILFAVSKSEKGTGDGTVEESPVKLPPGRIEARGFGTHTREVNVRYYGTLTDGLLLKDLTQKLGPGQRIPPDRFRDIVLRYHNGKSDTLDKFAKDGYETYRWYAWTNGSDTIFLAFTNSEPHRLRAKLFHNPNETTFQGFG